MAADRLSTTSYVVLGLIESIEPATAYALKGLATSSVVNFWAVPHTVLYSETERLARLGLLSSEQEQTGRRRRRYSLTASGREALAQWRADPQPGFLELRDPGLLALFLGADPLAVVEVQLDWHEGKLADYQRVRAQLGAAGPLGTKAVIDVGIEIERVYVAFWRRLRDRGATPGAGDATRGARRSSL